MIEKFLVNSMDMVKRGIGESDGRADTKHEMSFRSIFQLRKMAKFGAFFVETTGIDRLGGFNKLGLDDLTSKNPITLGPIHD
jgi:hypothetical protein